MEGQELGLGRRTACASCRFGAPEEEQPAARSLEDLFESAHVIDGSADPDRFGAPIDLGGWESVGEDPVGSQAAEGRAAPAELHYFSEELESFADEDPPVLEGARSTAAGGKRPAAGAGPRTQVRDAAGAFPQDIIELVTGHRQVPGKQRDSGSSRGGGKPQLAQRAAGLGELRARRGEGSTDQSRGKSQHVLVRITTPDAQVRDPAVMGMVYCVCGRNIILPDVIRS